MPTPRQRALDEMDERFIATIRNQSDHNWVMENLPSVPKLSEAEIAEALGPGALLRPVRSITQEEAVDVVLESQRRFDGGSLLEPLGWLFTNPTAPVPEYEKRFELHPLISALILCLLMFAALLLIVHLI